MAPKTAWPKIFPLSHFCITRADRHIAPIAAFFRFCRHIVRPDRIPTETRLQHLEKIQSAAIVEGRLSRSFEIRVRLTVNVCHISLIENQE